MGIINKTQQKPLKTLKNRKTQESHKIVAVFWALLDPVFGDPEVPTWHPKDAPVVARDAKMETPHLQKTTRGAKRGRRHWA